MTMTVPRPRDATPAEAGDPLSLNYFARNVLGIARSDFAAWFHEYERQYAPLPRNAAGHRYIGSLEASVIQQAFLLGREAKLAPKQAFEAAARARQDSGFSRFMESLESGEVAQTAEEIAVFVAEAERLRKSASLLRHIDLDHYVSRQLARSHDTKRWLWALSGALVGCLCTSLLWLWLGRLR